DDERRRIDGQQVVQYDGRGKDEEDERRRQKPDEQQERYFPPGRSKPAALPGLSRQPEQARQQQQAEQRRDRGHRRDGSEIVAELLRPGKAMQLGATEQQPGISPGSGLPESACAGPFRQSGNANAALPRQIDEERNGRQQRQDEAGPHVAPAQPAAEEDKQ